MRKADFRLILAVGAVCAILLIGGRLFRKNGASVTVQVDGELYGIYSLDTDQTIYINDTNVLVISEGKAYMSEADCPDGLCIQQGSISVNGTMIVCLPNRVVVQVTEEDAAQDSTEDGFDAVIG